MEEIYFLVGHTIIQKQYSLYYLEWIYISKLAVGERNKNKNKHVSEFCFLSKYHSYKQLYIMLITKIWTVFLCSEFPQFEKT